MRLKIMSGILALGVLIGCGGTTTEQGDTEGITYQEDLLANRLNPHRGFYDADYPLTAQKSYNMFEEVREDGYTLVYAPLDLEAYQTTTPLPNSLIATITQNLSDANASGVKLIFRVKYRNDSSGDDPTKAIILGHLDQLKSLLQRYSSTISVVQAGCIGAWGEWYSFTGEFEASDPNYKANRKAIIEKLVELFPDKYIQIRTPMHKELLFGTATTYREAGEEGKITEAIAYTEDIRAKVGHHNDCVLASSTDMGTYPSDSIAFWKSYVINDAKYAPVGGETCGIGSGSDATLSDCSSALAEFKRMHYSYLNDAYHPDVLQKWKDGGCYSEIRDNLGYRLVAQKLLLDPTPQQLGVSLTLINKGYAAPYVKPPVALVLQGTTERYRFEQDIDIRQFQPQESQEIRADLSLKGIAKGSYCLYLEIGEGDAAMRLSNSNLWDSTTQSNQLTCTISVE